MNKRMKKRIALFVIAPTMAFALMGCGSFGYEDGTEIASETMTDAAQDEETEGRLIADPEEAAAFLGYEKIGSEYYTQWEDSWLVPLEDASGYVIADVCDLDGDGDDELYILSLEEGTVDGEDLDEAIAGSIAMASPGNYYEYTLAVYEASGVSWALTDEEHFYSAADFGDNALKTLYVTEGAIFFDEQLISSQYWEALYTFQMMTYDGVQLARISFGESDGQTIYRYSYETFVTSDEYEMLYSILAPYPVTIDYASRESDGMVCRMSFSFDTSAGEQYTVVCYETSSDSTVSVIFAST